MSDPLYDDEDDQANAELANIDAQPEPADDAGPQDEEASE